MADGDDVLRRADASLSSERESWFPSSGDFYVCPLDHAPLHRRDDRLVCSRCDRAFGARGGVLDLDVIQAPDREAFDAAWRGTEVMSPDERTASTRVAERFLSVLGHDLQHARVLDVACGNGALTYGLMASPRVTDTDVFCFDHSAESMRVFLATVPELSTSNRLHPTIQDVHRLAYPDDSFDVVFGNAVLHHFLEYRAVLGQVRRVLKPGGIAVFAEPAAYGYLWATFLMRLADQRAAEDARSRPPDGPPALAKRQPLRRALESFRRRRSPGGGPEESDRAAIGGASPDDGRGLLDFIVTNTFFRLEHHGDSAGLAALTDKHYFLDDEIANLAAELGFTVRFAPYEGADYYRFFMRDMLTTYGVENPAVARHAEALYASLLDALPTSLHRHVVHFQFIILEKRSA